MKRIILASKSPRRIEILKELGISFDVIVSDCEEEKDITSSIDDLVKNNAYTKANAVFKDHNDSIVLGFDTLVYIDNLPLGKPKDKEECIKMIKSICGRCHKVITGCAIISSSTTLSFSSTTDVYVKEMTCEEIEEYASTKEPYDKAGGYAIQGIFSKYIDHIDGSYSNVVGLPKEIFIEKFRQIIND